MEIYCEQNLDNPKIDKKHKKMRIIHILRYVLLIIGFGLGFFIIIGALNTKVGEEGAIKGFILFNFLLAILCFAPFIISFLLLGRYIDRSNLEFDYLLNSGVFRIIKVVNRLWRKKMLEINISNIESIGKIESDTYDRFAASKETKKIFAICDYEHEENIFYLYYSLDSTKYLLHIEPNNEMVMALKRSVSRISIIDKSVMQSYVSSNNTTSAGLKK